MLIEKTEKEERKREREREREREGKKKRGSISRCAYVLGNGRLDCATTK